MASESPVNDEHLNGWPPEAMRIASVAHVHALGQISLSYNLLEGMMAFLFQKIAPMSKESAEALFHKLNNRVRVDLLRDFVRQNEKDETTRDAILHCVVCYGICTDNRNTLMHAIVDWIEGDVNPPNYDLAAFSKASSKDVQRKLTYELSVSEIRMVAEQMSACFNYADRLNRFLFWRYAPEILRHSVPNRTLPDTLPKPHKLIPSQPVGQSNG